MHVLVCICSNVSGSKHPHMTDVLYVCTAHGVATFDMFGRVCRLCIVTTSLGMSAMWTC